MMDGFALLVLGGQPIRSVQQEQSPCKRGGSETLLPVPHRKGTLT